MRRDGRVKEREALKARRAWMGLGMVKIALGEREEAHDACKRSLI